MTTKLTAADFTDPLIQVLGDLTGFQAGVSVNMKDTHRPIMDLMGIDAIDSHGYQEPRTKKRPFVARWISWAYRQARVPNDDGGPGLTVLGARAQWALTPAGVQHALSLASPNDSEDTAIALAFAMIEENTRLELDAAVIKISAFESFDALVDSTKNDYIPTLQAGAGVGQDYYNATVLIREALTARGIAVHPPEIKPFEEEEHFVVDGQYLGEGVQLPIPEEVSYHSDPYIVSLASEQTQCFGSFSPRSNVCGRCPLQGACLNVVRGKLAELAKGYTHRLQTGDADAAEDVDDTDAILAAAFGDEAKERDPEWDVTNKTANLIRAGADSKCYRCGGDIPKDMKAWWHRAPETGMYHEECY